MYILILYSIHYTLRWNKNLRKIPFWQNKRYKKCPLFTFTSSNSSKFYFWFTVFIRAEAQGLSLWNYVWDFPFSIPLRFYQSLYFCSTTQQTFAGLEDVLKASLRRLQRNNFLPSMTSWRRLAKMSWRRLEDVLEKEKLLRWRCLQDVSKTSTRLLGDKKKWGI